MPRNLDLILWPLLAVVVVTAAALYWPAGAAPPTISNSIPLVDPGVPLPEDTFCSVALSDAPKVAALISGLDTAELENLVKRGRVLRLVAGTRHLMLDPNEERFTWLRIISGEHKGKRCWHVN